MLKALLLKTCRNLFWDPSSSPVVGEGSFGKVYSGTYDDVKIAVKYFKLSYMTSPKEQQMLEREVCDDQYSL